MMRNNLLVAILIFLLVDSCASQHLSASTTIPPISIAPTGLPTPSGMPAVQPTITPSDAPHAIPLPPVGYLYHGVHPGGITSEESDVTLNDVRSYEEAAGKRVFWVYFSHNWYEGRAFPISTVTWIREAGSIPYIRLMLRSSWEQDIAEPVFNLQAIINGEFDTDLHNWCAAARDFGTPLLAEYGTEVNGEWFSWNGIWNGAGETAGYGDPSEPDGPERFRDAYRHIIQICRNEGAENITWVFHINAGDYPEEDWNAFENYYPGDDWIDWIGISNYGAQTPQDDYWEEFSSEMDVVYPRVDALTPDKPIFIAEFGVTKNNPLGDQAEWARNALTNITSFRWPRLIGFSWWNEQWQNDNDPAHDTTMRLQDNPELEAVFKELVGNNPFVLSSATATPTYLPLVTNTSSAPTPTPTWWQPVPGTSWQIQYSGTLDTSLDVQVYDIDLFDTPQSVIDTLHADGRKVICYFSAGSWEDWRPDAGDFPASVLGNPLQNWTGEKWLDIRQVDLLAPIMRARLDLAVSKHCDGVDPDNVDGYANDTGFQLTADDQLTYNRFLSTEAHARGLAIGLKNDLDQIPDLLADFDWALNEECFSYNECDLLTPFIQANKPVFGVEYDLNTADFCPQANAMNFDFLKKHWNLDAWRVACR